MRRSTRLHEFRPPSRWAPTVRIAPRRMKGPIPGGAYLTGQRALALPPSIHYASDRCAGTSTALAKSGISNQTMNRYLRSSSVLLLFLAAACGSGGGEGGLPAAPAPLPPPPIALAPPDGRQDGTPTEGPSPSVPGATPEAPSPSVPRPTPEDPPAPAPGSAPIANAGPSQTVDLGEEVTLDGRGSADPDGDPLTYRWTVRRYAGIFPPVLRSANTATPSLTVRDSGEYEVELVVSDGQHTSSPAAVAITVTDSVAPLPSGPELVLAPGVNAWVLDEATMTKTVDFSCSRSFSRISLRPDRVLVAGNSRLTEFNPHRGVCIDRGPTPELLSAFAIAPDGTYYGASNSAYWDAAAQVNRYRLYRLSRSGSSEAWVPSDHRIEAMDFGHDGYLYGIIVNGWSPTMYSLARINPNDGTSLIMLDLPVPATYGDIDIDSQGIMRTVINGALHRIRVSDGVVLSVKTVPGHSLGQAFTGIATAD